MHERFAQLKDVLLNACNRLYSGNLVTLAVFGSWARGEASPHSDIDVLIVADKLPDGRMKRVMQFRPVHDASLLARKSLWQEQETRVVPDLSPVLKTPAEVLVGSPLFLDMTDSRDVIFDRDDFFADYLRKLSLRMKALGTRRRQAAGGYYWEYKPDYITGEVIEL